MTPDGDRPRASAGWYPDPNGSGGHRYWDGHTWTGYRAAPPPPRLALDDGRHTLLVRYLVICLGLLAVLLALIIYAACSVGDTSMVVPAAANRDTAVPAAVDLPGSTLCEQVILAK
ncbi:hypothetical protein FIV07_04750 [Mycobacterium sp. THAF192]|nr:hypothetical protein FIV07_04750 [Mycobacterium sp. THAF192]